MSQEDQGPVSPSLHHSDSVPNIFSQINEFVKSESLAIKTHSPQSSIQKSVEGNVIHTSVISNLQHMLNLSNVTSRLECINSKPTLAEANCWQKSHLQITDRDQENNRIMSGNGLCFSLIDDCEVPVKKPKLMSENFISETEKFTNMYENDRLGDMKMLKILHRENLTELFFLQNGGNLMDYFSWKKRPNKLIDCYLFSEKLDDDQSSPDMDISKIETSSVSSSNIVGQPSQKLFDSVCSSFGGATGLNLMSPLADDLSCCQSPDLPHMSTSTPTTARSTLTKDWTPLAMGAVSSTLLNSNALSSHASLTSESSVAAASAAYETSQESIAELARQEAQVMEKITELRKKGLWSVRRIPKASEPLRSTKPHWDYVLEEMQWLAADFGQERKAKKAGARKIGRMVVRHFQDQQQKEMKAEREDAQKLKRIASNITKAVKEFWSNIEKVVQYKQQSRLEEKRRKALDMHLSFIVDQTEKYSTWLTEGLGSSMFSSGQSVTPVVDGSALSSNSNIDDDFKPNQDSTDDEETIEKEEQDLDEVKTAEEVAALQKEGEMSFEEFLKTLPEDVLNSATGLKNSKTEKENLDAINNSDADSYMPSEDSTDNEETLAEQENHEEVDHEEELLDLQKESEMPIEELLKKYQAMCKEHKEQPDDDSDGSGLENAGDENSDQDEEEGNEKDSEVGTEFLINKEEIISKNSTNSFKEEGQKDEDNDKCGPGKEITDIAATALRLQPTGYTLETAHVKTAVPFLLKHSLREYQHVGLDWLATMYEQRLNGILADEMGLGKTIQTIALLGFLACEKGIWGPHLIVVPTSVMLNWEMEFKKWCPAFKILTYYGNLKERKAKRQGWTKTNAFHVCITSYKLVIQDHQAFRRKKWKYFILDEAQNIKNFKSQRWQTLLNFHSQRRLLLTGTPLQNNLMELWSLMHFLMPHVFQSHREFKEWFSNPLTGMIEGSMEYNESLVKRLHKVLRPFLLRRLKQDVEKQMPKKYEHVVMCRLSNRQRYLYDDFMSQAKTKETLASGQFLSVINILMQLRKVCNHPNLFDPRPVVSPFYLNGIMLHFPSLAARSLERNPLDALELMDGIHPNLCDLECGLSSMSARRVKELVARRPLIVEIDSLPDPPSRLEPLPDGTQLIVRCTSPVLPESEDVSSFEKPQESFLTDVSSATLQLEELDVETVSNSFLNLEELPASTYSSVKFTEQLRISAKSGNRSASDALKEKQSPLYMESLENKRRVTRKMKLEYIYRTNQHNCSFSPVYGEDLRSAIDCVTPRLNQFGLNRDAGYIQCLNARKLHGDNHLSRSWESSKHLAELVLTPEQFLVKLKDMLHWFVFVIPPVTVTLPTIHLSHPSPSTRNEQLIEEYVLQQELSPKMTCLHSIIRNQIVQFPELRLIQYDCGKLQTMDVLLRRLKIEGHRALIFTQMTRMLDVLEAFLNFHGHRYLRLDGTTKVEQRQALMERFNMDQRIFCFILSTRSGGIGVNLTGADTVIFYDSDWNPTMDAQAQDRCHRIGQTRDVHIYRLISEKTVEENILKKANEKRLLGNVAIEGGNFTTAFFKQQTIKDLFEEPSGLESLVTDDNKSNTSEEAAAVETGLNEELIEQALCAAEDETDIQAVKVARAEQKAELAEFDENQPWDEVKTDSESKRETEDPTSNVEIELALLEKDLTPVERYAVSFMEMQQAPSANEELQKAEEEVGLAKEEWELSHLKALKQEEERRAELEEDEMLYTSLHYTAWKQQPKKKKASVDESFGETTGRRKNKAGRLSNELKQEKALRNEMKHEGSPSDSWEDSNLSTNIDDSRISSSSSFSTSGSSVFAKSVNSSSVKLKKPAKRLKISTSLVVKGARGRTSGASRESSVSGMIKEKKYLGRPLKRQLENSSSESPLLKKKRKKKSLNLEVPENINKSASSVTSSSPAALTVMATTSSTQKPQQVSVTKLLDNKHYLMSHGQRIIVQRVGNETNATISTPITPKLPSVTLPPTRDQFENKPTPILEKLSASVMTSSISTFINPHRASTTIGKTTVATTTVFPSHLHVSRLNQIVSSISQNTLQNATLAQSASGSIQYFLRPSSMVTNEVKTDGMILANSGIQQAAVTQTPQGANFVLLPQTLGKSNRLVVPSVANQTNKQSVLILPNSGKQNYIVTQQPGNRQSYILIPNNVAQPNFIITAVASNSNVPASRVLTQSVGFNQSGSKVVSNFPPLLQTQQTQVARRIVSPGLAVVSQQSIPVVQSGISNTVPILEKLAMQLEGTSTAVVSQHQQQYRPRIMPSATIVQPAPKQADLVYPVRVGQASGSLVTGKPSVGQLLGHLSSGALLPHQTSNLVVTGRLGGPIITKQSPVSLLANQSSNTFPGQSSSAPILSRLPAASTLPGQSSGIMLTSKPVQPVNVAQFIVNQPRSTISVEKLTQLAVNGQLVLVDGRHGQELVAGRSANQQATSTSKK